jgi:ectoine hydroxylase-related dioxygenase (phytanoyl-CoA dioxygenase family)
VAISGRASASEHRQAFAADGVVCLRGVARPDIVAILRRAADRAADQPRPLRAEDGSVMTGKFLWMHDDDVLAVVGRLDVARRAGELLCATRVHLVYDEMFAKPPGRSRPTPWHQDQPHWPLAGRQLCSVWLALDRVTTTGGALRYLAGSHRDGTVWPAGSSAGPPPGADGERGRAYDLEPGDAVVHHAMTLHASYSNTDGVNARRAYVTRWAGDDVRYVAAPGRMSFVRGSRLADGDRLGPPFFPELWRQDGGNGDGTSDA